ncbi:MAG: flagellar hook assembly protein FlgD [Thiobacillaceae bacterium]
MSVSVLDNERILAALNGAAAGAERSGLREVEDRFLKLLVTQLRNQDPMNPMQNAELTMQLAQMSTVEGINKLNAGLETLLGSWRASQTLQAAALIGRQVFVAGDRLQPGEDGQAVGGLELTEAASAVTVDVLDEAGAVLRRLDLGGMAAGLSRFVWDGKDAAGVPLPLDGVYRFSVSAEHEGRPVPATALNLDQVASVIAEPAGMRLELARGGRLGLEQVRQIF